MTSRKPLIRRCTPGSTRFSQSRMPAFIKGYPGAAISDEGKKQHRRRVRADVAGLSQAQVTIAVAAAR